MLRIVPYLIMLQIDCWTEKEIEVKEPSCIFTLSAFLSHFTVDSVSQWVPPPGFLWTIRRKLRPLTGGILLEGRGFLWKSCAEIWAVIHRNLQDWMLYRTKEAVRYFQSTWQFLFLPAFSYANTKQSNLGVYVLCVHEVTPSVMGDLMKIV